MALPLGFNTQGFPVVNGILYAGPVAASPENSTAVTLAGGATYTGLFEDWSAYNEIRVQSLSNVASAVGGVHIDWSMNGITQHATEAAGSALAGVLYDSGPVPRRMRFGRVRYVNGAGAQATFLLSTQLFFSPTDCRTREYLDNGNVPPLALLAAATYTGAWTTWGPYDKLNLVGSIDQAGTLFIDQSRDGGATTAVTEQWLGAIGEAFAFPTARAVGCNVYRLRFTAGGVNLAALVLTPYLTVGEVDHETPILEDGPIAIAPAGTGTFLIPVGARRFGYSGVITATNDSPTSLAVFLNGVTPGPGWMTVAATGISPHLGSQNIPEFVSGGLLRPLQLDIVSTEQADYWVNWYA
jgi:hypothetical protein